MKITFFEKLKSENKVLSDFKNENGIVLGKNKGKLLIDNSKEHILLTMPPCSGKGVSCIVPTALKTWKESKKWIIIFYVFHQIRKILVVIILLKK